MQYTISLDLVEIEHGNYHLTVKSDFACGISGLWVIDTGASKTVFDHSLTSLYALQPADDDEWVQSAGIGAGNLETSLGILQSFSMGGFRVEPMKMALIDLSHINRLYFHATEKEICGLIGGDFLHAHKAIIDYGRLEMTLHT